MNADPYDLLAEVMIARAEPWREQAECRGLPVDWFFPGHGQRVDPRGRDACSQCPVTAECREAGRQQVYGAWGGVSRRAARRDAAA
jgi:hypothetical protein